MLSGIIFRFYIIEQIFPASGIFAMLDGLQAFFILPSGEIMNKAGS